MNDGSKLGAYPSEFEVVEWYPSDDTGPCPDCGERWNPENSFRCPTCGLDWADVEAAAEFITTAMGGAR